MLKLEYLLIIDAADSFCKNTAALKHLLQSDSDIKIVGNKIRYLNIDVGCEIQEGQNDEKNNRFYHLRLKCEDQVDIEKFAGLGRAIRKVLGVVPNRTIQTLWDDISLHYSLASYPLINEIENLMRKLITKFMLTNVGLGWAKETIPDDLKKSSRTEASEDNNNYLYEVDFIQLSNFLFNAYRTLEIDALIKKISEVTDKTVEVKELSEFIPRSNWQRYFQPHVDCDASYLESRWEKLYKLRCKIAHNNAFTKNDYENTLKLAGDVKAKLTKAIDSLDAISVPEDEREELAESVAYSSSSGVASFITKWKIIESLARDKLAGVYPGLDLVNINNSTGYVDELVKNRLVDKNSATQYKHLLNARNRLIHDYSLSYSGFDLNLIDNMADDLIENLQSERSSKDDEIKRAEG